ncbi:WD40-repeat-containing domain protein [Phakopsora pachyrhizi]|uniref:Pre-rRNA-processing protein IPI3 n=1 Tax=Phakopsora pachyrhizi TaxID=170000 RepID=A0AAV0BPP2_PHAPC|nr:WD40-repeat-containing domain protein [Phakopsora pachyrhizi]
MTTLFSIPSSHDGYQSLSFHEISTSCQFYQLKTPSGSAYVVAGNATLPPRKTTVCLPSSNSLGSTVISLSGKDGRNGLLVWSSLNSKPTPSQKLIPPGRPTVVALSSSGAYLATGSADGAVSMWELSTGILLASFDAHYKAITCIAFSGDDASIITASDDAICCLIWSPLFATSPLLSTFTVPGPAHYLAVDPLERFIFVSYATNNSDRDQTRNSKASGHPGASPDSASTVSSSKTIRTKFGASGMGKTSPRMFLSNGINPIISAQAPAFACDKNNVEELRKETSELKLKLEEALAFNEALWTACLSKGVQADLYIYCSLGIIKKPNLFF